MVRQIQTGGAKQRDQSNGIGMTMENNLKFCLRHWLVTAIVIMALVIVARPVEASDDNATNVIEKFCRSEFDGVVDVRMEANGIVAFSKNRKRIERKRDPEFMGQIIALEGDPIFIVSGYQIISEEIIKDTAFVSVRYSNLAKSEGDGMQNRRLIVNRDRDQLVIFKLIKRGATWVVLDPPTPRISKNALIIRYKKSLESYEYIIRGRGLSSAQERSYKKEVEDYNFIDGL
jgi:hypothetical protein